MTIPIVVACAALSWPAVAHSATAPESTTSGSMMGQPCIEQNPLFLYLINQAGITAPADQAIQVALQVANLIFAEGLAVDSAQVQGVVESFGVESDHVEAFVLAAVEIYGPFENLPTSCPEPDPTPQ